jgi:outer membrane protein OmpA-like peptidoglycan-associated protein
MKRWHKLIAALLATLIFVSALTGCAGFREGEAPISLVIVIGKHANQNAFTDKSYEALEPLVRRAVYGGDVSVVLADGAPKYVEIMAQDGSPVEFRQDANNKVVRERRITEYTASVMEFLRSDATRAVQREVDLLAALKEAARILHDDQASEKHIVVMTTGISTTGRIDFSGFNLNNIDVSGFASALQEKDGILPDLEGINIRFIGLGDVAFPQELPDTSYPKLKALWEEIFVACGVSMDMISFPVSASGTTPNLYSEDEDGFPYVTVINFMPVDVAIREIIHERNEVDEPDESGELLLPDVGFYPDTANIVDEAAAEAILRPFAEAMALHLEENPDSHLYLLGTTATTTPGGRGDTPLSQRRANRLMETLVSLGVPADRLTSIGVGANVPAHLRVDEFRNGRFDSGLAQANRKATVYEINNKDFQEIMDYNRIDPRSL